MAIATFMAGWPGRIARITAGVVLIWLGLGVVDGPWSLVLTLIGIAPIAAGLFNFCLIAPLLRAPFSWCRCPQGTAIGSLMTRPAGGPSHAKY